MSMKDTVTLLRCDSCGNHTWYNLDRLLDVLFLTYMEDTIPLK